MTTTTRKNPYVGPSPFEQDDSPLFHGREGEANELFSLICAHSVVLFYSQSGAGKTSLLNARIIPRLKKQQAEVRGVARIGVELPKEAKAERIENVFVFNTLLSLQGKNQDLALDELGQMSLAQYLERKKHECEHIYFDPLHVLIFDQFEELFTSFPEHWEKRESFFVNISDALKADPFLRVVFAMREEHIAALDPFAPMLPQRLQKRFRLERLRADAALLAVVEPLKKTERSYGSGVAEKLVTNLQQEQIKYRTGTVSKKGEFVEPVQLQIVCHSLWESLPRNVKLIDEGALAAFGDVDKVLAKYYDDSLKKVMKTDSQNEGRLRLWFGEALITPIGTRGTVYVDDNDDKKAGGLSKRLLTMLEEQRLIRSEFRGGATWYELTHDRFIGPILQSNRKWFGSLSTKDSLIYGLEQKASDWADKERPDEDLLLGELLRDAVKALDEGHTLRRLPVSPKVREYISASEAARERRDRKVYRQRVGEIALASGVVIVLILIAIIFYLKNEQKARETRAKQVERGQQARDYAEDLAGSAPRALAFGIEAVGLDPNDAPPEAIDGLRTALHTADRKVWLPEGATISAVTVELSVDGKLALTVDNNELCVWDAVTGEKTFQCYARPEAGEWKKVRFFPDGQRLYAVVKPLPLERERAGKVSKIDQSSVAGPVQAMTESTVLVLKSAKGEQDEPLQKKLLGAQNVQISDDGQHILAGFADDKVKILDLASDNVVTPSAASQAQWYQVALSRDGSRLVAAYSGSLVRLLETTSDGVVNSFLVGAPKTPGVWDKIAFSNVGQRGVLIRPSAKASETFGIVWDNVDGRQLASFGTAIGEVESVAFSPDGSRLVVSSKTTAEIYDAATGNLISTIPEKELVLAGGTKILTLQNGTGTCTISIMDVLTGNLQTETYTTKYKITDAATTPDASRIIVVDDHRGIQIWTTATPLAVDQLSAEALLTEACRRLEVHQDVYEQVSGICKARLSAPVAAR